MGDIIFMAKLSVHLVTWNGAKYVPYLFDSLRKQSFKDWHLLIIDNNSQDGMVEKMKKELEDFPVTYEIFENKTNLGFAGGHNMAFQKANSEYVLMLNQDMYLMPECLEKMINLLDGHQNCASVSPRLMKWNFTEAGINLQGSFSKQVDSLGLKVYRNRRVVEQGAQEIWDGHKADILRVFGVSGALPMFRRTALQQVAYQNGEIFDESYQSYKEDVDLAYRLAIAGFESFVLLDAVAYHDRSAAGPKEGADWAAAINKKTQSTWVKYHSYKNHLMTLYKNEYWQNTMLDFPWILWYELKKFLYFLFFDQQVLTGLKEVWKLRSELKEKRQHIKNTRKLNWQQIRKLYGLRRI